MCLSMYKMPLLHVIRIRPVGSVKILVYMENVDRFARENWIDSFVIFDDEKIAIIQYSYQHRMYTEVLPVESIRLKDYTDFLVPSH